MKAQYPSVVLWQTSLGSFRAVRQSPILGEYGGWDRFDYPSHTVHIEYRPDSDRIKMVTMMRPDVTP
jgi:hypothetical protein